MRASTRWSLRNVRRVVGVTGNKAKAVRTTTTAPSADDDVLGAAGEGNKDIAAAQQRAAALLHGARRRRQAQQQAQKSNDNSTGGMCEMQDVKTAALEAVVSLGRSACLLSHVAGEQHAQGVPREHTRLPSSPLYHGLTRPHHSTSSHGGSGSGGSDLIESSFIEASEHAMGAGQRGGLAPVAVEGSGGILLSAEHHYEMSEEAGVQEANGRSNMSGWSNKEEEEEEEGKAGTQDAASALRAAEQLWQGCSGQEKMRWVRSTAQGKQAWSVLRRALALRPDMPCEAHARAHAHAHAEVCAKEASQSEATGVQGGAGAAMALPQPPSLVAAPEKVGQELLQRKVAAAEARQRRSLWRAQLRNMLSAEGSAVFVSDVKELQRTPPQGQQRLQKTNEACDEKADGKGEEAELRAIGDHGPSFHEFCGELGITRSPRRVYVMQRLLPRLHDKLHAPLSLAEVRELARQFSDEYDAVLRAHATRPAAAAVAAPQRALIAEELGRVQDKLAAFQRDLPLLKRLVHRMSK